MKGEKRFTKRLMALAASAVIGLAAYGVAGASGGGAQWGYEGDHGPEHWGELSHDYEACGKGKKQSPIDISKPQKADMKDIDFHYSPTRVNILNNGHTVQVNYDSGSYIEVNGTRYDLLQFHFHTPSEHTVGSKSFDMEMHLVHKSKDGALAVVGVLVEEGKENRAYKTVWGNLPEHESPVKTVNVKVDANDLLPGKKTYYTYSGSLTTPPCSEGVTWLVLTDSVELSADQIEDIHEIMHSNNRPTQPLHGRTVKEDKTSH